MRPHQPEEEDDLAAEEENKLINEVCFLYRVLTPLQVSFNPSTARRNTKFGTTKPLKIP